MRNERRAIFALLAAGRIDVRQAERLLAVLAAEREAAWMIGGGAAMAAMAMAGAAASALLHLPRGVLMHLAGHVVSVLGLGMGGWR